MGKGSYSIRKLKKALHTFPPTLREEKGKPKRARGKWMDAITTLNEILLDPSADLRSGVKAINEMLTTIENVLLEGFFREYESWLGSAQSQEKAEPMPDSVVEKGSQIHRLILARGKFILEILSKLKEGGKEEDEYQQATSVLFKMPDWMEEEDDEDDDKDIMEPLHKEG